MWNYRVVRKKNTYIDPTNKKERVDYTYAIHEAYYDENGHVGAITQDPVEPFGENVEELRHSWVMMAEAFGQPIIDYGNIPEPGYDRKRDPIGSVLDERLKEFEAGNEKGIPWDHVKRELEKKWGPFDEEGYRKQVDEERLEKEKIHSEAFIGKPTLKELIKKIYSDYQEYIQRDRDESPWKYSAKDA
ncbi:MAG: hypothetical protein DDT27_01343 [Dehalococcoidia bacterium]|nr:hypothetical protein [Chloroflexota bacterium]